MDSVQYKKSVCADGSCVAQLRSSGCKRICSGIAELGVRRVTEPATTASRARRQKPALGYRAEVASVKSPAGLQARSPRSESALPATRTPSQRAT